MTHTSLAAARPATAAQRTELLHRMLVVRRFEERRVELRDEADLHLGEEAITVGVVTALGPADTVVSAAQEHGHAPVRGVSADDMLTELLAPAPGPDGSSAGRCCSGAATAISGLSLAVELAQADVREGRPAVTVCLLDGAVTGPEVTECVDHAIHRQHPELYCSANDPETAGPVESFGMPAETVDGMDVEAVVQAAWATVRPMRGGGGPRLLELQIHGFRAQSMYHDDRRPGGAEGIRGDQRDPIQILADRMHNDHQLDDNALEAIDLDVTAHVDAALALLRRPRTVGATD
jgi:pyruvate dehydrogenase E1 component alpha subunit